MRCALAVVALVVYGGGQSLLAQSAPDSIPWEHGPVLGKLGSEATVSVPEGCLFTAVSGTRLFMEMTENPASGRERGTVLCPARNALGEHVGEWFVVFEYDPSGYVKDDDKGSLDADAILASLQAGSERGNEERRKRGWETLSITGWERPPYYDETTNNLTWAVRAVSGDHTTLNHSVRLLGRGGVMSADLVISPEHYAASLPEFNTVIGTFGYLPGQRYAEWQKGDKIAAYGLTALIGGAILAKTGLLQKFGKAIAVGVIALLAALKRLFTGKRKSEAT